MKTRNIITIIVLVLTLSAFLFGCTDTKDSDTEIAETCDDGGCGVSDNSVNAPVADNLNPPAFPEA